MNNNSYNALLLRNVSHSNFYSWYAILLEAIADHTTSLSAGFLSFVLFSFTPWPLRVVSMLSSKDRKQRHSQGQRLQG
jgi:hypothetical protein